MPRFMIVESASRALLCIIHECGDDPCTTESEDQAPIQCNTTSSVHAIQYKPSEGQQIQVASYNAVKESDRNANLNWQDELKVPNRYVDYRHKVVKILAEFEHMWDSHLGSIKSVKQRIELKMSKGRPLLSALC